MIALWGKAKPQSARYAALCKFSISGPAKHQVPTVPLPVILHYIDDRQN